jgi:hypothetical protein
MNVIRRKLKGDELKKALQRGHERRRFLCKYGPYSDYKVCPDCGQILDPLESCSCVEVLPNCEICQITNCHVSCPHVRKENTKNENERPRQSS